MRSVTVLIAMVAALATVPSSHADPMSYLDNGVIRLGVDLGEGGTITYLSTSPVISGLGAVNVINSYDLGREVTASYYAPPPNFGHPKPPWTGLPWNPDPAGDRYGHPSAVLAQSNDGLTIYTKTLPLQWGLDNVRCECLMEQWITLAGTSVQVHNRLTNNRSDNVDYAHYGAAPQALPAAYTNGPFWRLFTYSGSSPYTDGPLTEIVGWDMPFSATEHWAALVDDSGFGLGVFNAFATGFVGGFLGTPDGSGPNVTGTIFPAVREILDWNIVYEFDYALVLGTLDQIRAYAVAHRPDDRPDYHFAHDRQHFSLANATDAGWPVSGALHVNLDQDDPYIVGPEQWWQAQDVPRLYITAAYHTSGATAELFWTVPGQDFGSVRFAVIPDSQYHTYTLDLASSPPSQGTAYHGTITGIRFDPSDGNDPGGYVDIASITWKSPDLIGAANYQGLWWNAPAGSESGWGINFAHQGDVIFATWFTYDATGKAWWLSMTAAKTVPGVYSGTLYQTRGPPFNAVPFNPAEISATAVGTGTLSFTDANNGWFDYTVNGVTQSKTITRQVFGSLPTCVFGAQPDLTRATNYQDLWWAVPAGSEAGWGVNFAHQGDTIFATWFTYDVDGKPMWLSATAPKTSPGVYAGTLYRTTGPAFDTVPFLSENVGRTPVGALTLTFANGNDATFAYTVDAVTQSKQITRQVFRPPGTACQ